MCQLWQKQSLRAPHMAKLSCPEKLAMVNARRFDSSPASAVSAAMRGALGMQSCLRPSAISLDPPTPPASSIGDGKLGWDNLHHRPRSFEESFPPLTRSGASTCRPNSIHLGSSITAKRPACKTESEFHLLLEIHGSKFLPTWVEPMDFYWTTLRTWNEQ